MAPVQVGGKRAPAPRTLIGHARSTDDEVAVVSERVKAGRAGVVAFALTPIRLISHGQGSLTSTNLAMPIYCGLVVVWLLLVVVG